MQILSRPSTIADPRPFSRQQHIVIYLTAALVNLKRQAVHTAFLFAEIWLNLRANLAAERFNIDIAGFSGNRKRKSL